MKRYGKRFYTLETFSAAVRDVMDHMDDLRTASRGKRISKVFSEKIMLAVTQVNGCRYCEYGHTRAALSAGLSEDELGKLLVGEIDGFSDHEALALVYAQHYAESNENPEPESWERLVDYYGEDTARDIQAYIRMITVGNLSGNTMDALISRLNGAPAEGSSIWAEIAVIILGPLYLIKEIIARGIRSLFFRSDSSRTIV